MRKFFYNILVLIFVSLSVACTPADNPKQFVLDSKVNLKERQLELQKLATFDISKVYLARLKIDGSLFEVTNLKPARISSFKTDKGLSVTLLVFDKNKENLIFFTHDSIEDKGYEHTLNVEDLKAKKTFSFPVIKDNGKLVNSVVTPVALIVK